MTLWRFSKKNNWKEVNCNNTESTKKFEFKVYRFYNNFNWPDWFHETTATNKLILIGFKYEFLKIEKQNFYLLFCSTNST